MFGKEQIDTSLVIRPMDQVVGGHQHQTAIVAPTIFLITFPKGSAQTFFLSVNMEVGHCNIELAIRCAVDMRIADASLFSDAVARDDGLSVIQRGEVIAVVADGHKQ